MGKRSRIVAGVGAAGAVAALAVGAVVAPAGAAANPGKTAFGLAGDGTTLVTFTTFEPQKARTVGTFTGLTGDTKLVGIDYRVQNFRLYGVGDQGGIYTIVNQNVTKVGQLSVALSGTTFGVDFNPAANRLRIISDTGQNLRHNIDDPAAPTTTTADGELNTPPTAGATTGVTAAAYTNNDLNATTGTSLFDLNTTTDQVVLQSPANSGQLAATGGLGVDAGAAAGFDIYSHKRNGKTYLNTALASLTVGGTTGLYSVSLLTGEAERRGSFPSNLKVTDIAISLR